MKTTTERLELRNLLAAVTWDGGAGTTNWTDAANWSGDVVPGAADDVTIGPGVSLQIPSGTHLNSLVLESSSVSTIFGQPADLRFDHELRIRSGGKFTCGLFSTVTINGTGDIQIEAGGELFVDLMMQYGATLKSVLPVINHGLVRLRGATFMNGIQNFGTMELLGSGGIAGALTNEASGVINVVNYAYSPSSQYGPQFTIGYGVTGYESTSPIINRGIIRSDYPASPTTLPMEYGGPTGITNPMVGLTVYVNSTSSLGGTWGTGGDSLLKFARWGSQGGTVPVTFDSTFNLEAGTLILENLSVDVAGMANNTGLSLTGDTHATFTDERTRLAFLNTQGNASFEIAPGNRTLHVQDINLMNNTVIRINDGLLIHGNDPGFMRPWAEAPSQISPPYANRTIGEYDGKTASLEPNGSRYGLGYTTGSGLARFYPSHIFRGESFDDNDFIFFTTIRGDANFDRQVNFDDLLVVAQRYGQSTSRGYADGNFAGNVATTGTVDFDDLLLLAQNYGTPFAKTSTRIGASAKRGRVTDAMV